MRFFLTLMCAGALLGCATERSRARAGSLSLDSSVAVAAPAIASRTVDRSTITLPAGSTCVVSSADTGTPAVPPSPLRDAPGSAAPGRVTYTLAAPAQLVREVTHDVVQTATGHDPPSSVDLARGWGLKLWGAAGLVFAVLGLALVRSGHGKAAAVAFVGAVLVPLIGALVNSTAGLVVAGIAAAAAVTLFVAWHLVRGKLAPA